MHQTNNISSIQLFSEFFHENQEKFLSFAYSYIRYRQEAEDILMESMITLWENRDKWEEDSNLHGLLLTIIKNKALNYLAHLQVRLRAEEEINSHSQRELDLRISTLEACEPDVIFDSEIQHIVQKALKRMPNQSRQIFILSRYQNTPNKKIAEQLGISVKSVEFHITKALKILRTELKDYLVSILFKNNRIFR
ncbi:RNA polymerase sigma-70 factor [Bacteroides thetaiotaomicron]|nr:RNA polymerase sigma-70 factor [Bacteroides thetaiotaomicron]